MTFAVYATPPAVASLPVSPWTGLRHTWQGSDGSTWDLSDPTSGVFMTDGGITGLHMPQFDQYLDEYANLNGGVYRGSRAQVRNPEWTVFIWNDGTSQGFLDRYRALWDTLDPNRPGLWTVTDVASGESRTLVCRYRSAEELNYTRDPLQAGWAVYTVTLLAEDPFWAATPVVSPVWGNDSSVNFTGPSDAAPDFYISGATQATATLANAGDVDAWLTWTVVGGSGGVSTVSLGTDGGTVGFGAVAEGSTLVVSTDPTNPVVLLNGTDVSGAANPWDPREIPAKTTSILTIALTGTGTVQARFVPKYLRAF